jgi:serine/threonine-protein kinase
MPLLPETKLGAYEILSGIGAGGMGEVYRARDSKLGREVAIKVLPASVAKDPERISRFEREARLLAALNHPNIATLHGLEDSEGVRFLVMELIEGQTLAERIGGPGLAIEEALPIFKQIAEALEAAHERGIVHRDLKPANVKITLDGKTKVLDFGLAKAFGPELASSTESNSPTMIREGTETGVILGTAAYMSPEQARGKSLDKRTDIWSFGCCLFEALAGKAAFRGPTVSDTIAAILEREPDWKALPARTPRAIRGLLARCLTKDPMNRLRDVGDARIEIARALEDEPGETRETAPPRARWAIFAALGVAVVSAPVALWSLFDTPEPPAGAVVRSILPLPEGEPLAIWTVAASVAISPDGSHVAYVAGTVDRRRLYLRRLDELEARLVDGSEGAAVPFSSSDSQWIGFWKNSALMRAAVSGGAPQPIASGEVPYGVDWGEKVIVTTTAQSLSRVPVDGGEPQLLTTLDPERREVTHRFAQVLPDGRSVLFTLATSTLESWDDGLIAVASLESGEHRVVLQGGSHARYSPTGHLLYVHDGTLYAVGFDLEKLEVIGQPVPVLEQVMTSPSGGVGEFALAENGTLVYAPGRSRIRDRRVVSVNRQGRVEPLINVQRPYIRPRLSPDGRRLAITAQTALASIWLYDFERGTLTRWTPEWVNSGAIWSPDGRDIAFASGRTSAFNLYKNTVDGTGTTERLTTSDFPQTPNSWSPDGMMLAFQEETNDKGTDVWLLPLQAGRKPEPFLDGRANEQMASFSPDGRWVAYQSDETGQLEIYICRFPDRSGKQQVSTDGGYEPVWNTNGKELFYRNGNRMMAVTVQTDGDLILGRPTVLFEGRFVYHPLGSYDVTPDGQRFVLIDDSEAEPAPTHLVLIQNFTEVLKRLVPTK